MANASSIMAGEVIVRGPAVLRDQQVDIGEATVKLADHLDVSDTRALIMLWTLAYEWDRSGGDMPEFADEFALVGLGVKH